MKAHDRSGDDPPPPRSRLEDEVLEILVRAEQPSSLRDHVRRKTRSRSRVPNPVNAGLFAQPITRLGAGGVLVASLVAAILGAWVRSSSALAATVLGLASFGFLVSLYVVRFTGPGRHGVKRWRGRDVELNPPPFSSSPRPFGSPEPPWIASLRDRFRRPPRL